MAANTMPRRGTVNQALEVTQPYDAGAADRYRNQYPLPHPIPPYITHMQRPCCGTSRSL
ncbi:hypothetical protein CEP54_005199 [Fusarium duplospermum]|uniref:Uncharacterized protein n=1 Tax=Fusarium duplospermum TaxID=1325734 RepID=A0A428QDN4_9HYPO|nr:hypothetical protein CEP54_005199 [Fusarium duplospermum]